MLIKHICFGNKTVSDVAVSTRSFEDRVRYSLELGIPYGFLSLGESYEKMELPSYEEEPIQINGRTIGTIYETEVLTEESSIGVFRHPFHTGLYLRELEEEKDSDLITKQLLSINLDRERYQIIGVTVTPSSYPIIHNYSNSKLIGLLMRINKDQVGITSSDVVIQDNLTLESYHITIMNGELSIQPVIFSSYRNRWSERHFTVPLFNPNISQGYIICKDEESYDRFFEDWGCGKYRDELFETEPRVFICNTDIKGFHENIEEAIATLIGDSKHMDNVLLVGISLNRKELSHYKIRHASCIDPYRGQIVRSIL